MSELQELSDAATEGVWGVALGDTIATEVEQLSRGSYRCKHTIARLDDTDYDKEYAEPRESGASMEDDARFIVALVNAYREGRLIEVGD